MSIKDVTTAATGTNAGNNALRVDQDVTPSANSIMNYGGLSVNQRVYGDFNTGSSGLGPTSVRGVSSVMSGNGTHGQIIGGEFEGANYSATIGTTSKLYGVRGRAFSAAGSVAETFGVFGSGNPGNTAVNSYSLYAGDSRGATNGYGLYVGAQAVATNKYGIYRGVTTNTNQLFGQLGLGGSKSQVDLSRFSISATFTPSALVNSWGALINLSPGNITEPTTSDNQTIAERSIVKVFPNIAFQSLAFTNYTITDGYGMLINPPIPWTNTTITRAWGLGVNGNVRLTDKVAVGLGATVPTAKLHLAGSLAAATSAPSNT